MKLNRKRKRILMIIVLVLLGLGSATGLALQAFRKNLLYFFTPTQVAEGMAPHNRPFRLGGIVTVGSFHHDAKTLAVQFVLTDTKNSIPVTYSGVLPDLFREGQGIIAQGSLGPKGTFVASQVLAKHDANYMPPQVADALRKEGVKIPYTGIKQPK